VEIKLNTKVDGSVQAGDGRQTLTLSGGNTLTTDLYIPTFGVIPNSSYIPEKYLNANGFVVVDDYLKVKGLENVWAIGDISSHEPPQFLFADKQAGHLAKNILLILSNKAPLPYKDGIRGKIPFLVTCMELWLIFCRYGPPGWQEGRNWSPRKC
jgi:NADH dehydrogenase FAD-containing subunit